MWNVDDEATAVLMRLFYRKLWAESKPPIVALREAQLFVYRHPDQLGRLAKARGLDFGKEVAIVEAGKPALSGATADTKLWAGFILSGSGR